MLIFLIGGNIQADDGSKFLENLGKAMRDASLAKEGYDMKCIRSIRGMEKEGTISPAQAEYLIQKECKKSPQQQQFSWDCPFCGAMGMEVGRQRVQGSPTVIIIRRCINGHIWQSEL